MTDELVKRLRESAEGWDDCREFENASQDREAAGRIEWLERQLSLINNTLEVTITDGATKSWAEFCKDLIAETRELLGVK